LGEAIERVWAAWTEQSQVATCPKLI
jgi:uncharacterized protein YndB with AHSA1/START domain